MWITSDEKMNCQKAITIQLAYSQSYPRTFFKKNINLVTLVTLFTSTIVFNNNN